MIFIKRIIIRHQTLGIDKCLGFAQIFGLLQFHAALIDSATDLKKHPLFLNIARCYKMLVSLRNTLGLLQWGTRNEIPRFIEFVIGFVQFTMTLPKPPPLSKILQGSRKDRVFANRRGISKIVCLPSHRAIVVPDNGIIFCFIKPQFMNERITE
jgi:hypothetical protein